MHPTIFAVEESNEQLYLFILDMIDTKFYSKIQVPQPRKTPPKNVCIVDFVNKGMDQIHLSKIFRSSEVTNCLPDVLKSGDDDIPKVTFRLNRPIRNKILNYKEVVSNLNITTSNDKFVVTNLPNCECHLSDFCDENHKHIVTGDLRIIEN